MRSRISAPKDFWAGLLYISIGAAAFYIARDYRIGTAGRMGPGYFPIVLSGMLVAIGALSLARSLFAPGAAIDRVQLKPMALVLLAPALFAWLLPRAGAAVALLALCVTSAAASRSFRLEWTASAAMVMLVGFCVAVFVKGLGVPMPILGSWFEPFVTVPWLR